MLARATPRVTAVALTRQHSPDSSPLFGRPAFSADANTRSWLSPGSTLVGRDDGSGRLPRDDGDPGIVAYEDREEVEDDAGEASGPLVTVMVVWGLAFEDAIIVRASR